MKTHQFSLIILLTTLLFSSCMNRQYGHLTMRVGTKKASSEKSKKEHRHSNSSHYVSEQITTQPKSSITKKRKDVTESTSKPYSYGRSQTKRSVPNKRLQTQEVVHKTKTAFSKKSTAKTVDNHQLKTRKSSFKNTKNRRSDGTFLSVSAISTALLSAFMFLGRKRTKRLANWASNNVKTSRRLLIGSRILLGLASLQLGRIIQSVGFELSDWSVYALSAVFALNVLLYPVKNTAKRIWKSNFIRRKLHDLALVAVTSALLISFGNISSQQSNMNSFGRQITEAFTYAPTATSSEADYMDYEKRSTGEIIGNILLSILALALFVGVIMLLAVISCELSCNGQEGLAALVMIGGATLAILGIIYLFKRIWKPRGVPVSEPTQ